MSEPITETTVTTMEEPPDGAILWWPANNEWDVYLVHRDDAEARQVAAPGPWQAPATPDAPWMTWAQVIAEVERTHPDGSGADSMDRAVRLYREDDPAIEKLSPVITSGLGGRYVVAPDPGARGVSVRALRRSDYLSPDEALEFAARLVHAAREARAGADSPECPPADHRHGEGACECDLHGVTPDA